MKPSLLLLSLASLLPLAAAAQTVYRCPGSPESFTNLISPEEAKAKGCKTLDGVPITVVQTPRRAPPPPAPAAAANRPPSERVDPATQKARDSDRRGVLEAELRTAEAKLAELKKEYADGQPERRGDERNYQKYLDRVEQMKAAVQRQEADVAAIKRELAKAN